MQANSTTRPDMEAPEAFEPATANDAVNPHAQRANQVQAAKDELIEDAFKLASSFSQLCDYSFQLALADKVIAGYLALTGYPQDALPDIWKAEPPASEDAEPELPPRFLPDAATVAQWQREAGDGMG